MTRHLTCLLLSVCASGLTLVAAQPAPAPAKPTALAAADFDEDGMPDLVVGYAREREGAITVHRGNVDAVFPNSPEARQRRAEGVSKTGAFLGGPSRISLPIAVDFLGVGDFDNDGHQDVLVGTRGEMSLQVLRGDGRGGLSLSADIDLEGRLNALAVGDVNKTDGVPDVVAALSGASGPSIAVFESPRGVVASKPEIVRLPDLPTILTLGRIRSAAFVDIAAAAGDELFILEGRDRRLLLDESGKSQVAPVRLNVMAMPASITSLAWGNFLWEPAPREELAITTTDGRLAFLDIEDSTGATIARSAEAEHRFSPGTTVVPVRLSGLSTLDLVIVDAAVRPLQAMSGLRRPDVQDDAEAGPARVVLAGLGKWSYPDVEGRPLAVHPMRLNGDARPDLVLLHEGVPFPTLAFSSPQAIITVNTSSDSLSPGDGLCTLREAINNANANADTTAGDCAAGVGLDTISFSIGGGGSLASIAVAGSGLPAISDGIVIDGTTQGCAAPPCIELNGTGAGAGAFGLRLSTGGNTVRGLVINRFTSHGIYGTTSGNVVEGNRIGTDWTGTVDQGNGGAGIRFQGAGATFNTIGGKVAAARNLVSGNTGNGVFLFTAAASNDVLGNLIGTNAAGSSAIPNGAMGVELEGATSNNVGGAGPGDGNVISGNGQYGVLLDTGSSGNTVLGNFVGLNPAGTTAIGNTSTGVYVYSASLNVIGGTAPGARNVVSGNGASGIFVYNGSASNEVLGNYVGIDATGTVAIPNAFAGVAIQSATQNTVGGAVPGARNVLSGNGQNGVYLALGADSNDVLGNYIGVDPTGASAIPNQTHGVRVIGAANAIGGAAPDVRNVISGNLLDGVFLSDAATGNVVSGNYIGVDATGAVAIGNGWNGVELQSAPSNTIGGAAPGAGNVIAASILYNGVMIGTSDATVVQGNLIGTDAGGTAALGNQVGVRAYNSHFCTIGGTTPGARNVISGNVAEGVHLDNSSSNNVWGNFVGTNTTGMTAVPNRGIGIWVNQANDNLIGGTTAGAGNVISGNGVAGQYAGLYLQAGSAGNTIQGNLVGTNASGTAGLGNTGSGVAFVDAGANLVGGTGSGSGNVVAGNALTGVSINSSTGVVVQGNSIGTDATGTLALGNGLMGVRIRDSLGARIGGTLTGEGNRIVNSGQAGVIVHGTSAGGQILGNAIAGSGLLGIELGESDGVTANDPGDADTGPNDLQNYPVLTSALASPSGTVAVGGSLESASLTTFRIEFFATESCDAAGHGEGRRFLGASDVTTDGSGAAPFSLPMTAAVQAGEMVTATATSTTNGTSEFSACVAASCSSLAVFPATVLASDQDHLTWGIAADVRWVKGDLSQVGSYATLADGIDAAASGLDVTADQPTAGTGLYYLVRPLICGSWQSTLGGEPGRDSTLP